MNALDLENPDHAYLFAFLQADGHLYQGVGNKGRLAVELSARDAPILQEFQRICAYPSAIRHRTRATNFAAESTTATWTVCAREFRESLIELGLPVGRKSSTVTPPTVAFSRRDYLRGLIDADGAVGRTAKDLPFVSLTTASDALKSFFCEFAEELTGTHRTVNRNKRDAIYNILYSCEDAVTLAQHLYYPGALALPRKREAAADVVSWIRPAGKAKIHHRRWTPEELVVLRTATSAEAAAEELGRTVQSCSMRRWRMFGPQKARVRLPQTRA